MEVLCVIIWAMPNDKIIFEVREKESFELHVTDVTMTFIKKGSNLHKKSLSFTD
jgi:hypothetical protein